jgi:hypothetical protein
VEMLASHRFIAVMPGLDPGICGVMDCRVKPGNDGWSVLSHRWNAER